MNEEFLVSASQQLALITSLPFVHTARRYYRLNGLVRSLDSRRCGGDTRSGCGEAGRTVSFRGSKSRNKVSVGEPAEGSLEFLLSLGDPRAPVSSELSPVGASATRGLPGWPGSRGVYEGSSGLRAPLERPPRFAFSLSREFSFASFFSFAVRSLRRVA